jgi:hypothetical protein
MNREAPVPKTVTLSVPFRIAKRGGRKEMHLPEGMLPARKPDNTLVKALARAFRWKQMLESGEFVTLAELARHEGVSPSYVHRILQLTLLSPNIVEAALKGKLDVDVTLSQLLKQFPPDWQLQANTFVVARHQA